ncbi:MAG: hypothetical protein KGR18_10100 [Acidobacteria bacterium]|nr:hypothetical protein [Acidobacteriota bacterium]
MSRRWKLTLAALFLAGVGGDWLVWAYRSADLRTIGRIIGVTGAAAGLALVMHWTRPMDAEWPEETIESDGRISRTAYLARPDHERATR